MMAACTVTPGVEPDEAASETLPSSEILREQSAQSLEHLLLPELRRSIEASDGNQEGISQEPAAQETGSVEPLDSAAPESPVSASRPEAEPTQEPTPSPTSGPTPTPSRTPRPTRTPTSTPTEDVRVDDHDLWLTPTSTKVPQTAVDSHPEEPENPFPDDYLDEFHGGEVGDGTQEGNASDGHGTNDGRFREEARCESDPSPKFTSFITDLDSINTIWPTIALSGNWLKNRSYLAMKVDENGLVEEQAVYAPADAILVEIIYYTQPMQTRDGDWVDVPQYDLRFRLSCEVMFWFDHLSRLDGPIADLAPKEPSPTTRDASKQVSLKVATGDVIGYTTGTITAHTWDFIMTNESKEATFANQDRYRLTGDLGHLLRTDCPYDYYEPEMREAYYELFGGWGGKSEDPTCGETPDKLETISGGWFKEPFVNDGTLYVDPGWGMVAAEAPDGWIFIDDERNTVRVDPSNRTYVDPKTVTTEHCYESTWRPVKYAYLKLQGDMEVAVAIGDGPCPSKLPEDHVVYYR